MNHSRPLRLILIGLALLLVGVILPFLMVIRILEPTFLLSFLSYAASVSGLIVGTIGTVLYARISRRG